MAGPLKQITPGPLKAIREAAKICENTSDGKWTPLDICEVVVGNETIIDCYYSQMSEVECLGNAIFTAWAGNHAKAYVEFAEKVLSTVYSVTERSGIWGEENADLMMDFETIKQIARDTIEKSLKP